MKEYPEPTGRVWEVAEKILVGVIIAGLMFSAYMALDFASWMMN